MSLLRLLALSHSMGELKDGPSEYKLALRGLPKFGSSTPRRTEKTNLTDATPSLFEAPIKNGKGSPVTFTKPSKQWFPDWAEAAAIIKEGAEKRADEVSRAGNWLVRYSWNICKLPLKLSERSAASVGAVTNSIFGCIGSLFVARKQRQVIAPVQTEWALEKITPIRNDLTDADFEIHASKNDKARPAISNKLKPALQTVGKAWNELSAQLVETQ
jgi:hypothetical protein